MLAIHVGIILGAVGIWKVAKSNLIQPATSMMGGCRVFRLRQRPAAILTPEQAKKVSDADIDAFRNDYQAELGKFVSGSPTPRWSFGMGTSRSSTCCRAAAETTPSPSPQEFENGMGLIIFQVVQGKSNIITPSTRL